MEWFYAHNQQQKGPLSTRDLERLLQTREIHLDTLVWKQGMPQWQSYRFARNAASGRALCAECGKDFALDEVIEYDKLHVCGTCKPIFFQRVKEGAVLASQGGVWRSNKIVVMTRDALLPDRCVKCNAPANGYRLKRVLRWPQAFTKVAAEIRVGLCEAHRKQRRNNIILAWAMFAGGLVCMDSSISSDALAGSSVLMIVASLVIGSMGTSVITAQKIEDRYIQFRGGGSPYLESLPEWQ